MMVTRDIKLHILYMVSNICVGVTVRVIHCKQYMKPLDMTCQSCVYSTIHLYKY